MATYRYHWRERCWYQWGTSLWRRDSVQYQWGKACGYYWGKGVFGGERLGSTGVKGFVSRVGRH